MTEFGVHADGEAVVYKYPLSFDDTGSAQVSIPGSIKHVGRDPRGDWCVWAVVWPGKFDPAVRRVIMRGTGDPLPVGTWGYLATAHEGPFVFHFFVGGAA